MKQGSVVFPWTAETEEIGVTVIVVEGSNGGKQDVLAEEEGGRTGKKEGGDKA